MTQGTSFLTKRIDLYTNLLSFSGNRVIIVSTLRKMSTLGFEKVASPTVFPFPASKFNARNDAEMLKTAFRGIGCDKKTVIGILCNRDNAQRVQIGKTYLNLYGEDLKKRLKSETSGNLTKLLVSLVTPLNEYLAEQLHDAMEGMGTDEKVLIEILTTLDNASMYEVKRCYQKLYGKTLEEDIKGDTSGHFKRLCISLAVGNRNENTVVVDKKLAMEDAKKLYDAGEGKWGTDESTFNSILVSQSHAQLRQVFQDYSTITGHAMEEAIKNEFSGDIKNGLLAIVKIVQDKSAYFSERLHKSMKGLGTDDKSLIRILVYRSEIDLGDIKLTFKQMYGDTLENWIIGDTSGDYKAALLAIVK
uniref:Annexin n=1 Tax=Lygus hesperus TaxID=30085 RepID=A0A0A9XVT8_LYGHE